MAVDYPKCNKRACNSNECGRCKILTSSYGDKPCPFFKKKEPSDAATSNGKRK